MAVLITIFTILIIGAIIYLNRPSFRSIRTREEFLNEMVKFLEGKLEPMAGDENSFRIEFKFDGHQFVFEDMEMPGFKDKVNKGFLRCQTSSDLDLQFEEKTQSSKLLNSEISMFNKSSRGPFSTKINSPDKLKSFEILSNNLQSANSFFSHAKVVQIFSEYNNADQRGYHFMALRLVRGQLSLEFNMDKRFNPSLQALRGNVHLMEDHIKNLIVLKKVLSGLS